MYICDKCKLSFELSQKEEIRLGNNVKAQMEEFYTRCPHCDAKFTIVIEEIEFKTINYRCPISGCAGWVDYIESGYPETPFWGCGECGSRWRKKESLFAEISEIVKKYKYRKKSYILQKDGTYLPSDLSAETPDYDEKVEKESMDDKFDDSDSFFRD